MALSNDEESFDFDFDYDYNYKNQGETSETNSENSDVARDSNGNILLEGDAVTVIKDLKVKGSSTVIKRGTKVKSIRLTDNVEEVEGKVEGGVMVLKACFLKKA
jgi:protein PhnA